MSKVKVYGKSQGWTALGIVAAYVKMNPFATLEDINKAFPRELFASKNTNKLLIEMSEYEKELKESGADRVLADFESERKKHWFLTLEDGTEIRFYKVIWGQSNFPALTEHAAKMGIEIASFEESKGGSLGFYELEYLADFSFNVDGRMTVNTLQQQFKDAFNACLRVYETSGKKANPKAKLAGLRSGENNTNVGAFEASNTMKVMDFEYQMKSIFGIHVEVARADDSKLSNDNSMLKDAGNN